VSNSQPYLVPIYLSSWYYATRLACLAVVGFIVGIGLLLVTDGKWQTVIGWLTAIAVPITFFLSAIFFRFYFKGSNIITSMLDSRKVIGWAYTPDKWEAYLRKETSRKSRRMLGLFLVFTAMGLATTSLIYLEERAWDNKMLMPAAIGFFIGLLIFVTVQILDYGANKQRAKTPATFVMGLQGFYITGSYYSWRSLGRDLVATRLIEDSEIDFAFQVRSNGQNYDYTFRIPIPESAQPDMPKIVQFLTENPELRFVP